MVSLNSTSDPEQSTNESNLLFIPASVRFWCFLISNTLSVLCSFFVLFHLLFDRTLRQAVNNHVIIILLFLGLTYELTTVPLMLYYYRVGDTWEITRSFSHFWTFIDYLCFTTQLMGFAWASIERHILIFHNHWLSTRMKRFFIHYLPLIIVLTYCFIYHFALILFPFCETSIVMSPFNGVPVPCILFIPFFIKYDAISHQIAPTFIIGISSIALFLRVLRQKARLHRSIQWRKQRKMIIQLLSISILYFLFIGPRMASQLCVLVGLTTDGVMALYFNSAFFAIYIVFLFPFVCCGSMPELGKKLKKLFLCQKQRQIIAPEAVLMAGVAKQRKVE